MYRGLSRICETYWLTFQMPRISSVLKPKRSARESFMDLCGGKSTSVDVLVAKSLG